MRKIIFTALALVCAVACTQKKDWKALWDVKPADNTDFAQMDCHYAANQARWDATFEFLKHTDLDTLSLGIHQILGEEAFAIVSEYVPKEAENCRFEAHRKYVDLQYIISGEEKMGVIALDRLTEVEPYVETSDIAFYGIEDPGADYEIAGPDKFFLFFPSDAHRPSMKSSDDGKAVRKVVVKVLY